MPVETTSPKHEVGARTLRPKLHRLWEDVHRSAHAPAVRCPAGDLSVRSDIDLTDVPGLVRALKVDQAVAPVRRFQGGTTQALGAAGRFLGEPFARYAKNRSVPEAGAASHMSPYLHFGQISPVEIALAVREARTGDTRTGRRTWRNWSSGVNSP